MIDLNINNQIYEDIELMIFDKDGTLFQLYPYCSKMVFERTNAICNVINDHDPQLKDWLIKTMGVDLDNKRIFPEGPIGVYSKYYAMDLIYEKMTDKGYPVSKNMIQNAYTIADEHINSIDYLKDALVPVNGMVEFIEKINGNCKCAIYSNDMTNRLKDTLNIFKIDKYFDCVLGADLVEKHKPDPMGVLKIMDELDISPENTVFVGDSALDIESGKRAKCKYLLSVLSDISDLEFLKSNSNELVEDFTKIRIKE